jgi:hypothetical protein
MIYKHNICNSLLLKSFCLNMFLLKNTKIYINLVFFFNFMLFSFCGMTFILDLYGNNYGSLVFNSALSFQCARQLNNESIESNHIRI